MNDFEFININNGIQLYEFLNKSLFINHTISLNTSNNVIYLNDGTTLNWKSNNNQIRINCKENAKTIIEQNTNLKHIGNGKGDNVHPYSFLLNTLPDLIDAIASLRKIELNQKL